jgi:hypothetical protein
MEVVGKCTLTFISSMHSMHSNLFFYYFYYFYYLFPRYSGIFFLCTYTQTHQMCTYESCIYIYQIIQQTVIYAFSNEKPARSMIWQPSPGRPKVVVLQLCLKIRPAISKLKIGMDIISFLFVYIFNLIFFFYWSLLF